MWPHLLSFHQDLQLLVAMAAYWWIPQLSYHRLVRCSNLHILTECSKCALGWAFKVGSSVNLLEHSNGRVHHSFSVCFHLSLFLSDDVFCFVLFFLYQVSAVLTSSSYQKTLGRCSLQLISKFWHLDLLPAPRSNTHCAVQGSNRNNCKHCFHYVPTLFVFEQDQLLIACAFSAHLVDKFTNFEELGNIQVIFECFCSAG